MPCMDCLAGRIVVVLPTWVGDAVMATPALSALRRAFARAQITWIGSPAALEVLAGSDLADATLADASRGGGLGALLAMARRLRAERFDLAVLLSNSFRTGLLCRLGRVRRRIGYARDGRGWLLTDRLAAPRRPDGGFMPTPAIGYYLALAEALGCDVGDRTMRLAVEDRYARQGRAIFQEAGIQEGQPVVVINPGASFGSSKLWSPRRFAAVADGLSDRHGARVIVSAGPLETDIAAAVVDAMHRRPALNLAERAGSLGLLKAVTAASTLMITGDTGPRHIAAALGVGVVTIFGSTDPDWTTIDYPRERIVRAHVPCSPCQKKLCPLPPGPQHHQCMERITAEMVLAAAEELMAPTATGLETPS